jgi:hypothetical protein
MTAGELHAVLRTERDLPFVEVAVGVRLQLLQVNIDAGLWVIRVQFDPGSGFPLHRHGGPVYGYTIAGRWKYEEFPEVYEAGTYHFDSGEHDLTLVVPDGGQGITDVLYICNGVNINKDADGSVTDVQDARSVLAGYLEMCEQAGHGRPHVIGA